MAYNFSELSAQTDTNWYKLIQTDTNCTNLLHILDLIFIVNKQRQEIHNNWKFLLILWFQKKKPKRGDGEKLKGIFSKKNHRVIKNIIFKKSLEFLGFSSFYFTLGVYWQKKISSLEILETCVPPLGRSIFFLYHLLVFDSSRWR